MSMQSLKKIGQKLLKSGIEALTVGRTDIQTVQRVLHNTPPLFVWWGIKMTSHSLFYAHEMMLKFFV